MTEPLASVLVPGLGASARLYAEQVPELWQLGPVTIADHTRDESIAAIARRVLAGAPPRFALLGLSMGGYISFEILRQAPDRVAKLVLLDTSARPDLPEQTVMRRAQMSLARSGRLEEIFEQLYPRLVHTARRGDQALRQLVRQMTEEVGASAFVRQQTAIIGRPDSRPGLAVIGCPTLVIVGDGDLLTPPERAEEIARGIPGAQLLTIPECGHLSTLEQPHAVTRALVSFLQG
ncbi:MAG TPA: alpha/beta fold hydrolase [Steroidobacteraceae bacterium]|nr:alpha/beta fold hydrolase [Steroidobacteraceae bacterium]